MKKYLLVFCSSACFLVACGNDTQQGHSIPIDSTNVNGTAPATYAPNNPTDDTLPKNNVDDTGTNAHNVHNTPSNNAPVK